MTDGSFTPEHADNGEPHFLADPDVLDALARMLDEFSRETDRGAVLVAAEIVAAHLARSLKELAPANVPSKHIKKLLTYPGVLNTLAARADVAFMAGHISQEAYRSIDLLRTIRNTAAHSQDTFSLKAHLNTLHELCELGPGAAVINRRLAMGTIMRSFIERLLAKGFDLDAEFGHNPFATPADVIDYLTKRTDVAADVTAKLQEQLPRTELAFGIWLLVGLIAHHRKALLRRRENAEAERGESKDD